MITTWHYLYNPDSRRTLMVGKAYVEYLIEKNEVEFAYSWGRDGNINNYYTFRTDNE